jgi:8-oxo-dGTP diphosphatase
MVYNEKRNGWEMPGGTVEEGECAEEAVMREFFEEAGFDIEILGSKDIGHCCVCACLLLNKLNDTSEMKAELFADLPEKLAFDRTEYETVIPWARSVVTSLHK